MDFQDFSNLQEAYLEVVDNQQLGEGYKKFPAKKVARKLDRMYNDPNTDTRFGETGRRYSQMRTVDSHMRGQEHPLVRAYSPKKSKAKEAENRARGTQKEQVDIYDVILSHLLDEGYAETPEAAEVIMGHMSDEWREDIVEELTGERKDRALKKGGYLADRVASGKEGQPLERRNRSGDITMRTTQKGPTKRGGMGLKGRSKSDWYGTDETHGSGNKSRRRRGLEVKDTSEEL